MINTLRNSITIFLWKHYKYYRHIRLNFMFSFLVPIFGVTSVIIRYYSSKGTLNECKHILGDTYTMSFTFTHSLFCIILVLWPIVAEKKSGVKEFLRQSCRYSTWNLATLYALNVVLSLFTFGVVLATAWLLGMAKHYYMIYMMLLVVLYVVSHIAFWFALSVLFNESKV